MAFCAARSLRTVVEVPIGRVYGPGMSKMGAHRGGALGRAEVVYGYATTILRETTVDRHILSRNKQSTAAT